MTLSGVLAAVSFATDSIPVLIGAMVVAPLYPALARVVFSVANGHIVQAARALGTASLGVVLAALAAMAVSWAVQAWGMVDSGTALLERPLLEERVRPGWYSFLSAAAAGIAGAAAYLKHKMDALVGTVASLALVPAAAAAGIAWSGGDQMRALGGLALLVMNIGLIIAMGLVVVVLVRFHERHLRRS